VEFHQRLGRTPPHQGYVRAELDQISHPLIAFPVGYSLPHSPAEQMRQLLRGGVNPKLDMKSWPS